MDPQELQEKLEKLETRLAEVERFMLEKKNQQITFPLDLASKTIIQNL